KSGQQTEKSVLSLWQRWLTGALAAGIVLDIVVDAHHTIEYLKYAVTRSLLTTSGCEQANDQRLSPQIASDVNFDITKNTILDSELFPEHFEQITRSILTRLPQLPSIVKAHFSWNWQCTTLTRGDELVNLRLPCIQPYHLFIPDYTTADGRRSGRGSCFFGKQEPDYNFVLPHRDPLRCPIVALAIFLHYVFDQEDLISKVAGWDWSCAASWRKINVIFGKQVGEPSTGDAMRKMFSKFLEHTSIHSEKKLHLARRTVPSLMEDMGVIIDAINVIGHWMGNTLQEAVTTLARFYVGEQYCVPWVEVDVLQVLQAQLFPFAEEALARVKTSNPGPVNYGTINFLELLQQLRPFFWQGAAAIHCVFPESALLKRLKVLQTTEAAAFFTKWPDAREVKDAGNRAMIEIGSSFRESATQSAFVALAGHNSSIKPTVTSTTDVCLT
ncbi:hypothetical protein EDB86DRAFT_2803614, partial [Lactarius hatsudake]